MSSRRKSGEKSPNCSFCQQRPRERNDLCNRCRQKVEARANKLLEQKVHGDIACILQAVTMFIDEIPTAQLTETQAKDALKELIPLYTVRKQSEYQYKGRKGNTCWCLPDRIFREAVYFLVPGSDTEQIRDRTGLLRKLTRATESAVAKYQELGRVQCESGHPPRMITASPQLNPCPGSQSRYSGISIPEQKQHAPRTPTSNDNHNHNHAKPFVMNSGLPQSFQFVPTGQVQFVQTFQNQQYGSATIQPLSIVGKNPPVTPRLGMPPNVQMRGPVSFGSVPLKISPSQFGGIPMPSNQRNPVMVPNQPFRPEPIDHTLLSNLFTLCRNNELPQLRALLQSLRDRGAFATADDLVCDNRRLIHNAAHHGRHHIITLLVTEFAANVNSPAMDPPGWTALHFAANRGQELCLQTLLSLGANPNLHGQADNLPPLHLAVRSDNVRCAQVLVRHTVTNVNEPGGPHHDTVFHLVARSKCNNELVKMLVNAGASFSMRNSMGNTPFHEALLSQQLDPIAKQSKLVVMFNDLKDHPCDFHAKNQQNLSVFEVANTCSPDVSNTFHTFYTAYSNRTHAAANTANTNDLPSMFPPNTMGLPPLSDLAMTPSPPPLLQTKEESSDSTLSAHGIHVGQKRRNSEHENPPNKRQRLDEAMTETDLKNQSNQNTFAPPLLLPSSMTACRSIPNYMPQPNQATLSFMTNATARSEGSDDLVE